MSLTPTQANHMYKQTMKFNFQIKDLSKKIVSWEEEQYSTIDQTQNNKEEKSGTSCNKKFQVNYKDI